MRLRDHPLQSAKKVRIMCSCFSLPSPKLRKETVVVAFLYRYCPWPYHSRKDALYAATAEDDVELGAS